MLHKRKCLGTVAYMGGVPAVLEKFCRSWGKFMLFMGETTPPGSYVHDAYGEVSFHAHARNELAREFRGDWLFQTDTDHEFEPDILQRMLRTMEEKKAGVVLGLYTMKAAPYGPLLFWHEKDVDCVIGSWENPKTGKRGLPTWEPVQPVMASGAGCLLVRRWVFERIRAELGQEPFTPIPVHPSDKDAQRRKEGCYAEDRSFFWRLAALSPPVTVWLDTRVESHHLLVRPLSYSDYQPEKVTEFVIGRPAANGTPEKAVESVQSV